MTDQMPLEVVIARIDERTSFLARDTSEIKQKIDNLDNKLCTTEARLNGIDKRVSVNELAVENLKGTVLDNRRMIIWLILLSIGVVGSLALAFMRIMGWDI